MRAIDVGQVRVTLLLVPVLYTIVIENLKLIRWHKPAAEPDIDEAAHAPSSP